MVAMWPGETKEQAKRRAAQLRADADQARRLARQLAAALDQVMPRARDSEVWAGPFADRSTAQLKRNNNELTTFADALRHAAGEWEAHARTLDAEAG